MKELNVGIITDLQYADLDPDVVLNRYFRQSMQKLQQTVRHFNASKLSFIVNLGDTIDRGFENFDPIVSKLANFKAPLFNLAGNHDFEVDNEKKKEVYGKLGIENSYHCFDKDEFRFCFLDGNEISTFANPENSPNYQEAKNIINALGEKNEANANEWNGGIGKTQLDWFRNKLKEAQTKKLKVVVFCHYPIFPNEKHSLLNYHQLLELISEFSCLKAWFCGHNHAGNYDLINNCHVVNFKGIVDYELGNSFCKLRFNSGQIKIDAYGREIERTLNIS